MIRIIILVLVLALLLGGVYVWLTRVSSVEHFLSKRLNAEVVIQDVRLGWGRLTLEGLKIKNPSSSAMADAFQCSEFDLEMSPSALFKSTVYIDRITIHDPVIGVELYNSSGSDNNWVRLLRGFPSGGDQKYVIRKLTLTNLQFEVLRSNGKRLSVPVVPVLEFENLGEKGALSVSQLARVIFQTLLNNLSNRAHLGAILDNVTILPQKLLDGAKLPIEDSRKSIQEGLEKIKRKTKEASEFLQDLFSRK